MSSKWKDIRIGIDELIWAQFTCVGYTVDVLALRVEFRVGDDVESDEARDQHYQQQWETDEQYNIENEST